MKIIKIIKNNKNIIFGILVGVMGFASVYAISIASSNVSFNKTGVPGATKDNVKDALDELYVKANTHKLYIYPTYGGNTSHGGYFSPLTSFITDIPYNGTASVTFQMPEHAERDSLDVDCMRNSSGSTSIDIINRTQVGTSGYNLTFKNKGVHQDSLCFLRVQYETSSVSVSGGGYYRLSVPPGETVSERKEITPNCGSGSLTCTCGKSSYTATARYYSSGTYYCIVGDWSGDCCYVEVSLTHAAGEDDGGTNCQCS